MLDRSRPYGEVYGSAIGARYCQDGKDFDAAGNEILKTPVKREKLSIVTDEQDSAAMFLRNILRSGPLSKSAVYKAAEGNNQRWEDVKKAADQISIIKFKYLNSEQWKLPEET